MRFIFLSVAFMVFFYGCQGRPPPPPIFRLWEKQNASANDVKEALVECGYDNPYVGFNKIYVREAGEFHSTRLGRAVTMNDITHVELCMKRRGFRYLLNDGKIACDYKEWAATLEACKETLSPTSSTQP